MTLVHGRIRRDDSKRRNILDKIKITKPIIYIAIYYVMVD
jgi:hypothetical protein